LAGIHAITNCDGAWAMTTA